MDPLAMGAMLALYRNKFPQQGKGDLLKFCTGFFLLVLPTYFPNVTAQTIHITWQYFSIGIGFTMILDASLSGKFKILHAILTNPLLVWLGKICYGLYVYHLVGIALAYELILLLLQKRIIVMPQDSPLLWCFAFFVALLITISLAWFSYWLMEKRFLKLKNRFSHISFSSNLNMMTIVFINQDAWGYIKKL